MIMHGRGVVADNILWGNTRRTPIEVSRINEIGITTLNGVRLPCLDHPQGPAVTVTLELAGSTRSVCLQAEAASFADLVEEGDNLREDPLALVRRLVEKAEAAQQEPGSEAKPPEMLPPRVYMSGNHMRSAGPRRERPPDEAAVRRRVGRNLLQPCVLQLQLLGGLWLNMCGI